mmetsp:Transcript_54951/g.170534  ORF Transcript_54951/g.170534 Transcript_54951/m.170534 type:complete len:220 (+) Transcript_54951:564-1223(+)
MKSRGLLSAASADDCEAAHRALLSPDLAACESAKPAPCGVAYMSPPEGVRALPMITAPPPRFTMRAPPAPICGAPGDAPARFTLPPMSPRGTDREPDWGPPALPAPAPAPECGAARVLATTAAPSSGSAGCGASNMSSPRRFVSKLPRGRRTFRFQRMLWPWSVREKLPPVHFRSCDLITPRWWNGRRTWQLQKALPTTGCSWICSSKRNSTGDISLIW